MKFIAASVYADNVIFTAESLEAARHWVINHLDLSKNWEVLVDLERQMFACTEEKIYCPCCAGTMNGYFDPISEHSRECNACGYRQDQ